MKVEYHCRPIRIVAEIQKTVGLDWPENGSRQTNALWRMEVRQIRFQPLRYIHVQRTSKKTNPHDIYIERLSGKPSVAGGGETIPVVAKDCFARMPLANDVKNAFRTAFVIHRRLFPRSRLYQIRLSVLVVTHRFDLRLRNRKYGFGSRQLGRTYKLGEELLFIVDISAQFLCHVVAAPAIEVEEASAFHSQFQLAFHTDGCGADGFVRKGRM